MYCAWHSEGLPFMSSGERWLRDAQCNEALRHVSNRLGCGARLNAQLLCQLRGANKILLLTGCA